VLLVESLLVQLLLLRIHVHLPVRSELLPVLICHLHVLPSVGINALLLKGLLLLLLEKIALVCKRNFLLRLVELHETLRLPAEHLLLVLSNLLLLLLLVDQLLLL
jgi:hypothetical protein